MPWRLILAIVVFAVLLIFITLNLENRCDVSFGFTSISEVPVFLTVLVSFAIGLFCAFPLAIFMRRNRGEKSTKEKIQEIDEASPRNTESNFSLREKFIRNHSKSKGGGKK